MINLKSMGYIALFLIVLPIIVWASPAEEPEFGGIPMLDTAQNFFGSNANFAANSIDSFFANQRADDELGRSNLRIRTLYDVRERSLPKDDTQIRFNLRLPELEEKFHIRYVGIDGKESPEYLKKLKKKKADANIIRIIKKPTADTPWLFRSDAGLNASLPPKIFVRSRLRKSKQTGTLVHRFVEQFGWFSNEGVKQETNYSIDQPFSDIVLFRFNNIQEWNISKSRFSTAHGPSLFHRVTDDDAFSYASTMSTIVRDGVWYTSNYRLNVAYRRNIYHNWIFVDVTPGLDFPKEWSFRRTPFVLLQVEALLGYDRR